MLVLNNLMAWLSDVLLLVVVLWLPRLDLLLVNHNRLMRSLSDSGALSDDLVRSGSAGNLRCLGVQTMRLALDLLSLSNASLFMPNHFATGPSDFLNLLEVVL